MPLKSLRRTSQAFKYVDICKTQTSASLCDLKVGKLRIDCCFLMSKMQWGQLNDRDAGVMYLDLMFHQPADCRIASATITMNLHEVSAPRARVSTKSKSALEITEFFGPQTLTGEKREKQVSTAFEANPKLGFAGSITEGIGWSRTSEASYSSRWKFTGTRFTIDHSLHNEEQEQRNSQYRQLVWHLEENELERQSLHHPIVHSAFAFHHRAEPFYIDLDIQVKMHRWHHRLKQLFICPPTNKKASTRARIEPGGSAEPTADFAQVARDLDYSMTEANLHPMEEVSEPRPRSMDTSGDRESDARMNLTTRPSTSLLSIAGELTGQELPRPSLATKPSSVRSSPSLSSSSTLVGSENNSKDAADERASSESTLAELPECSLASAAPSQLERHATLWREILHLGLFALSETSRAMTALTATLIMGLNMLHSILAQAGNGSKRVYNTKQNK